MDDNRVKKTMKTIKTVWLGIPIIVKIFRNKMIVSPIVDPSHEFGNKGNIPPRPLKKSHLTDKERTVLKDEELFKRVKRKKI